MNCGLGLGDEAKRQDGTFIQFFRIVMNDCQIYWQVYLWKRKLFIFAHAFQAIVFYIPFASAFHLTFPVVEELQLLGAFFAQVYSSNHVLCFFSNPFKCFIDGFQPNGRRLVLLFYLFFLSLLYFTYWFSFMNCFEGFMSQFIWLF